METTSKFQTLELSKKLTNKELINFRLSLKPLTKLKYIKSLCLEEKNLYMEFDSKLSNLESFKHTLMEKFNLPITQKNVLELV